MTDGGLVSLVLWSVLALHIVAFVETEYVIASGLYEEGNPFVGNHVARRYGALAFVCCYILFLPKIVEVASSVVVVVFPGLQTSPSQEATIVLLFLVILVPTKVFDLAWDTRCVISCRREFAEFREFLVTIPGFTFDGMRERLIWAVLVNFAVVAGWFHSAGRPGRAPFPRAPQHLCDCGDRCITA